jgi:hypothetical protein
MVEYIDVINPGPNDGSPYLTALITFPAFGEINCLSWAARALALDIDSPSQSELSVQASHYLV